MRPMLQSVRPIRLWRGEVRSERREDGTCLVRAADPLGDYPPFITDRLEQWAARQPEAVFLTQRTGVAVRREVTYGAAWHAARAVAQALVDRGLDHARPVAILSENSIEHALLTLACLYAGIPVVPVSPAYALMSQDFARLRQVMEAARPGLVLAGHAGFAAGIAATLPEVTEIVMAEGTMPDRCSTHFSALLATTPGPGVERPCTGRYREAAVHVGINRHAERRDEHAQDALRQPADDRAGVRIPAGRKAGVGGLAALASHIRRQPQFRHRTL
jgi:acyl-CoA synthetase (AMP-forming)/AMP-acid ligase II